MKVPSWIKKLYKKKEEVNPFTEEINIAPIKDYSDFKFKEEKTSKKAKIISGPLISKLAKIGALISFIGNGLMIFAVSFINGGYFNIFAFALFILSAYYVYAYLRLAGRKTEPD